YFSSNSNLKMALQKMLLKKRLKYRHPLPPKTSFCDKTIGSRELIFWTIPIQKCMNNLDFFQPNLRRSSGSHCPVWRGMTLKSTRYQTRGLSQTQSACTTHYTKPEVSSN